MPDGQVAALERRQAELLGQLSTVGAMRSGTLSRRCRRCGRTGCGCAGRGGSGHDPILSLTRKRCGKTVTRIIPAHAGAEIEAENAEYRRFRCLSQELIEVGDALSEARPAAGSGQTAEAVGKAPGGRLAARRRRSGSEQTAEAVRKGASGKRSRPRSARKSTRKSAP